MSMIELLSKLDPQISPYIANMQDSGNKILTPDQIEMQRIARRVRCEKCVGRKRIKVANETGAKDWEVCPRCFGSGRKQDGLQVSSASRSAPSNLSQEQIANLVQGMKPERYRAAAVKVTRHQATMNTLIDDVRVGIVLNQSQGWRLSEDLRQTRCLGLARVAVHNLMQGEQAKSATGKMLMCCTAKSWRQTWADRAEYTTDRLEGWVGDAGQYMYDRMIESIEEAEAA